VKEFVEKMLVDIDRRALKLLSTPARCIVLLLRMMGTSPLELESVQAMIEGYGVRCRNLNGYVRVLESYGLARCHGSKCSLTELGRDLSEAVRDFLEEMRTFAYSVIEGSFEEGDVVSHLVTGFASTVGLIESYVEEPSMLSLYLSVHAYIVLVSSLAMAYLARISPKVLEHVRSFYQL
jgi:hypothetical protein